jgi:hypothetical protein
VARNVRNEERSQQKFREFHDEAFTDPLAPHRPRLARRASADGAACSARRVRLRARGEVGLDLHRQRRGLQRLSLSRHLADQQEAGFPGRLRHRPRLGLLRRQLELERRQLALQRRQPRDGLLRRLQAAAGPVALDFGASTTTTRAAARAGTFKIDNTELYVSAGYGPVSVKYSHAISDFFGVNDSKNSWYLEGNGSYEISSGFSIIGHLGYQKLKGNARVIEIGGTSPNDSITDWKIGVTYDLSGFLLGAAYVGTNRDLTGGTAALTNRNISSDTVVLSVSKSF